jgi:hypothetical protein
MRYAIHVSIHIEDTVGNPLIILSTPELESLTTRGVVPKTIQLNQLEGNTEEMGVAIALVRTR